MRLNCINFTPLFVFLVVVVVVVVCLGFFFIVSVCYRINGNHGSIKINHAIDFP